MKAQGLLEGRVVLVTGASRGIGEAIAHRFAAEGAAVVVTARSMKPRPPLPGSLVDTVEEIEAAGGRVLAVQADLASSADRARLVEEAAGPFGPVEVLVNSATASFYRPFLQWTERRFDAAFEVNVRAPFDLAQRLLPGMRRRDRAWILNVSSAAARHPAGPPYTDFEKVGGDLLYGMTQAALDRMSTGLAAELYDAGVTVNSLAPEAAVLTPGFEALGEVPDEVRLRAEPVEAMAEAALALCLPDAPTGRVVTSRALLAELGREVRTLDGRSVLAKA